MDTEGTETAKEEVSVETTPEVKSPTAEELQTLQAQLKDAEIQRQKLEDSYKGLQRTHNKTSEELKSQANVKAELESLRDSIEILASAIVTGAKTEEDIASIQPEKKQDVVAQLKKVREESKKKAEQEALAAKGREYYQKTVEAGFTEKNIEYYQIRDAVISGDFGKADAILAEQEAKKVTEQKIDSTPKETEEERINKLVEERLQKVMKEKNLLKTDNAVTGGGSLTLEEARKQYTEGKLSREKYAEIRKTQRT